MLIRRLTILLLIVGCGIFEEDMDNCVLKGITHINYIPFVRYECYENVYTKKKCMDKVKPVSDFNMVYNSYITESCSEFCADSPGQVCHEY